MAGGVATAEAGFHVADDIDKADMGDVAHIQ
jgi:hypothetical protein